MRSQPNLQPHLEARPSGFYWRRRWPHAACLQHPGALPRKMFLLFPLRTHLPQDAKTLARKLTLLSDIGFAAVLQRVEPMAPDIMETLLVELCRFQIEAADLAREMAPARSPERAEYEQRCDLAALDALRRAVFQRDREVVRDPLRAVAARLDLVLDEQDPDWQRLAMRALRAMIEAKEETMRRDQGQFDGPALFLRSHHLGSDRSMEVRSAQMTARIPPPRFQTATQPVQDATAAIAPVTHSAIIPSPIPAYVPSHLPVSAPVDLPAVVSAAVAPDSPPPSTNAPAVAPENTILISEATESYIDLRSAGYRSFKRFEQPDVTAGKSWGNNSSYNVRSTGRLIAKILGDIPVHEITDENLLHVWQLVVRLPNNFGRSAKEARSPQEVADDLDRTEARNAKITKARMLKKGESPGKIEATLLAERIPRMRVATVYRHMQDFQRLCKFLVKRGFLAENIMADHIWEVRDYERRELMQEDSKRDIWVGHTDALFRTPIYQNKLDDVGNPLFWAPLIALHMGFRSEEILQLAIIDIQVLEGIPCIVLQQGPGQSLKSAAARRTVPIHENLLALGFMRLVNLRKQQGEPRLFPWVQRSGSKETFTENFSKTFTRFRKDHGLYAANRDFHSFRTTFNHLLIGSSCADSRRRYMMGHVERDVGIVHYNPEGFAQTLLLDDVNAVKIDISMIRHPFDTAVEGSVAQLADHRLRVGA